MNTPLLFIIFNRPEPTWRVFEEIRKAKPARLFVAADGPRADHPADVEKCQQAREVVSHVDWPCAVTYWFRDDNPGCKIAVSEAITQFFEVVEEGIVLEDDCLPDPTFFQFCEEMLQYYRDEEKIGIISGHNIEGTLDTPYSYIFTRYGHLWGWASWRRVWQNYDVTMKHWANKENREAIRKAINDKERWNFSQIVYQNTYLGKKDTWDYQWETYRLLHGVVSILPKENMIENLGFGPEATHTKALKSALILPRHQTIFPLKHHPGPIVPNEDYDKKLGPKMSTYNLYKHKLKDIVSEFLKK